MRNIYFLYYYYINKVDLITYTKLGEDWLSFRYPARGCYFKVPESPIYQNSIWWVDDVFNQQSSKINTQPLFGFEMVKRTHIISIDFLNEWEHSGSQTSGEDKKRIFSFFPYQIWFFYFLKLLFRHPYQKRTK